MSIGIAIAIVLLLVLVLLGLLLLGVGVGMFVLRSRGSRAEPARDAPPPRAATPQPAPRRPPSAPPKASRPPAPAPAAQSAQAPPLASSSGLLGFFDDEAFVSPNASTAEPQREHEGAKTELFQRGKMAIDWDDDSDEAEATEIFSAHGAAGDLAEFAFDDDDQNTGRFGS